MNWNSEKEKLGKAIIGELYNKGMIHTWYRDRPEGWTLVSGLWSPFYINLRPLCSYPDLLMTVGKALGKTIEKECGTIQRVVGIAMAGIPISVSISLTEKIPSCFTRKLEGVRNLEQFEAHIKEYGQHSMVEGKLTDGDAVVLVDDLVTRLDSKLIAFKQVQTEADMRELTIDASRVLVLFDREQGAREMAADHGITLYSLIPFESKGITWLQSVLDPSEYDVIKSYLQNPQGFQESGKINELIHMAQAH
jgi:orotate phosphoribosyltransferase